MGLVPGCAGQPAHPRKCPLLAPCLVGDWEEERLEERGIARKEEED